jgi:hypothetical protein
VIKQRNANLFKKGLSENGATFEFEDLIPKPYPAWSSGATLAEQRLCSRGRNYIERVEFEKTNLWVPMVIFRR